MNTSLTAQGSLAHACNAAPITKFLLIIAVGAFPLTNYLAPPLNQSCVKKKSKCVKKDKIKPPNTCFANPARVVLVNTGYVDHLMLLNLVNNIPTSLTNQRPVTLFLFIYIYTLRHTHRKKVILYTED